MRYRGRMSARTPRRSFAAPFVVTLAAVPACYVQSAPPAAQPEPTPQQNAPATVVANPPRPQQEPVEQQPTTVVANPPRPQEPPPTHTMNPPRPTGPAAGTTWHVFKTKDGCEAALDVSCPKGATCNPPPPHAYTCPASLADGETLKIVKPAGSNVCQVDYGPMSCPPNTVCNPPRPRTIACPK